jgi:hypothetical protein
MANTINNVKDAAGIIAKAAAATLMDNMQFCKSIDKADASDFDGKNGYKAGDTINVSVPARYIPQETFDITSSIQDSVEEKRSLPLDISSTVGMEFDSTELATEVGVKSIVNRFVIPAAESLAQNVEQRMLQKATQATYNSVGTAGSNAFTVADVLAGRTRLNQNLCPHGNRSFLLNSASGAEAVDARKGFNQSANDIAQQYREGKILRADSFDWMENELIYNHTNGNDVTGVAVNDASAAEGASTLAVDGLTNTTGTVTKGTVFTIAGVYAVHPITKQTQTHLQQFVVTADATANGSGQATLSISPSIYAGSGGLQNVSALPADDAALVFVGAASTGYAQNLQFCKSAFRMVSVPLVMPQAVEFAAQETVDGVTVQIVRAFDILERRMVTRLDFLGGLVAVRPEWACRVTA